MQKKPATQSGENSALRTPHSAFKWVLVLLPFAYLWFRLIDNLRLEWSTDPQYGYGWVVPLLCLGLLIRRWHAARSAEQPEREKAETLKTERQKKEGDPCVTSPCIPLPDRGGEESGEHPPAQSCGATGKSEIGNQTFISAFPISAFRISAFQLFVFALAFLYLPTRLVEAATPEWRPIQWSLAITTIGLTLCVIGLGMGRGWLRQLAFPICFLLVAVPWPTLIEAPIIQALTRLNTGIVVEVLGVLGVPAMQHGNVIEVSTGMVGIDDACSGIRSFQSSLMISLFFGEFYRFGLLKRLLLVPVGFTLAIAFNVLRTSILTLVAAKKGIAAISQYHDETGITITILCTLALWGVAAVLRKTTPTTDHGTMGQRMTEKENIEHRTSNIQHPTSDGPQDHGTTDSDLPPSPLATSRQATLQVASKRSEDGRPPISAFQRFSVSAFKNVRGLAISLLIWLFMVEAGVQIWYRVRESRLVPTPDWSVEFPKDNPTFQELPIRAVTEKLLRYDEARQGAWREPDGTEWQVFYFNWHAGRVAGYLAKRHTPDICMPAAGRRLLSGPELIPLNVHGVELPMRCYVFSTDTGLVPVFQCRWEAGVSREDYVREESARFNLVRGIWAGRGRNGQKVLQVIVEGFPDAEQAKAALARELDKLIKVQGTENESRNLKSCPVKHQMQASRAKENIEH